MQSDLRRVHQQLGIPADYGARTGLQLQVTPDDLVPIGSDIYGRSQRLRRAAASAWVKLRSNAAADGLDIQVVSAYRPLSYQVELIQRCLDEGEPISQVLTRIAAPGYSEHQGGCALDLTSPGYEAVEEEFEHSSAFDWLQSNAKTHNFVLSYPRDNPFGVVYEPWHWCYQAVD